eukprot:TRINITY_DN414_c0_g1_i2.p1 TRINITY_DN414_c0_g1~~TRINITY_DN414_c0_g1_i2.p1  ORF type:complete len:454 (-),score=90.44 TRINITY_DN414_c0_g1_i2:226-1587(-)
MITTKLQYTPPFTSFLFSSIFDNPVGFIINRVMPNFGSVSCRKRTKGDSPQGTITIYGEEVADSKMSLKLSFQAKNLEKKDFLGKSDPFLVINRKVGEGNYQSIHKTEYIKQNLNPTWKPFTLTMSELCNGQTDRFIKIDCYDWDSDTSQDYIGSCEVRVSQLLAGATFPLINPKKTSKSSYSNSGVLILANVEQIPTYSFIDYVAGGFNISLMFAIDFTGSNGNPAYPSSLHYRNPNGALNGYQLAISSVGNIVAYYDYDKMFPVFGFGGCFPPSAPVSHNFPLNGNPSMPEVAGIDGVLSAYNYCLQNCTLSGPTNFAPIIKYAIQLAQDALTREELKYFILLILTDGEICDMSDTVDAIVKASFLPISIIITGIGSANFANMNVLDGDDRRLKGSDGMEAQRDIVQFVPLRDMPPNDIGSLAAHTLAEIPGQFMSYVQMKGIPPPPRIVA